MRGALCKFSRKTTIFSRKEQKKAARTIAAPPLLGGERYL
jgi:hypothetical protein